MEEDEKDNEELEQLREDLFLAHTDLNSARTENILNYLANAPGIVKKFDKTTV